MTTDEIAARQRIAEAAAREAGRLAQSYIGDLAALKVESKGPQDVVTEADRAVERAIVAALSAAFPRDTLLGEEDGGTVGDACWVIDPIDGTANFARGLPHWCVSIAFVLAGRTEVGVIFDASFDALYSARRGAGATRNEHPIRVSGTEDIGRALVEIGYSRRTDVADFGRITTRMLECGINVTQSGSAALGLARVADGRLDGYAERHLYAWDVLAGLLLVEEAGGRVNAFLTANAITAGNVAVASTPALYATIEGILGAR